MTDLAERMSKMKREHGGKVIDPTVADLFNAKKGLKEQKRDSMRALLSKGDPVSGMSARIGRIRRLKRRSR
jgi:hypothetical protein